jgi:predicted phosphodiesterase
MKKLLILSDIHANWPALEAVLHNEESWDGVAFCGDVVGVGPQPVRCLRWVAEHAEFRVRGDLDNALAFGRICHGRGSFCVASPITQIAAMAAWQEPTVNDTINVFRKEDAMRWPARCEEKKKIIGRNLCLTSGRRGSCPHGLDG